ncbi:MAG: squalene--hopene cyclase [Planctomycetaceae bacterium]|nr:squalene--hopene cyclase [Planctomycetaceae bacterium]
MIRTAFQYLIPAVVVFTVGLMSHASAGEELTLETVDSPGPNQSNEPLAAEFSKENAIRFLDQASLEWTQSRKCFACHTNYLYLLARPAVDSDVIAHQQVRHALEDLVETRWQESGPRWDAEVVMSAAMLALNDAATTGQLHATTRKALDRMWTVQRADGGIDWLKCGWPPMESDDAFGAAMLALAAGAAGNDYCQTPTASSGLTKLRSWLSANPAPTVHHQAMLLWADTYLGDLLTAEQREETIQRLRALQQSDGGWNLASLGDWQRADGSAQDVTSSDGYATGFVIYVLRRAEVPADDQQLQRGVTWLKANQRQSGRWYTRSLNKDSRHFISHAGSAFAVLALTECEQ